MSGNKIPLIAIVGETASGKTELSIKLAQMFNGEIITCDSRTIYKGMEIGTASPSESQKKLVKHHLLNILDPLSPISVAEFKKLCNDKIYEINKKNKIPILVGGSGLYIDSVIFGYDFLDNFNQKEKEKLNSLNNSDLINILIEKKLELPNNIKNKRHLVSAIINNGAIKKRIMIEDCLVVGLKIEKSVLEKRVKQRIEKMFLEGIVQEVKNLSELYGWEIEPMKTIGYREFKEYFEDQINKDELKKLIQKDTLNYAKRQRTWFKRNKNIHWITEQSQAVDLITTFLNKYSI
jgi:tRNA dimethylallyltransferase